MAKAALSPAGASIAATIFPCTSTERAGRSAAERQTGDSGIRINLQNLEQEV